MLCVADNKATSAPILLLSHVKKLNRAVGRLTDCQNKKISCRFGDLQQEVSSEFDSAPALLLVSAMLSVIVNKSIWSRYTKAGKSIFVLSWINKFPKVFAVIFQFCSPSAFT